MLVIMMIIAWSCLGALGLLLLKRAVLADEEQAKEDDEHDLPDRGE